MYIYQVGYMTGSRVQGQSTTERLLAAADRLFYRQGLRVVSMDDIAAEAGLTKRTLYYHFASKDVLIAAYLERRLDEARHAMADDPDEAPKPRILRAFADLERAVSHEAFRGCPFVNAVAELNDRTHPATALAVQYKEDRRAWFESLLRRAAVPRPETVAGYLMTLWEGAIARALVTGDAHVVQDARGAATALLAGAP